MVSDIRVDKKRTAALHERLSLSTPSSIQYICRIEGLHDEYDCIQHEWLHTEKKKKMFWRGKEGRISEIQFR